MTAPHSPVFNRPDSGFVHPGDRVPTGGELAAAARFVPCSLTAKLANDSAWMAACLVAELDRLTGDELRPAELCERLATLATTARRCGALADAVAHAHGHTYVCGDLGEWMAGSPANERAARLLAELAQKRQGGVA